MSCENWKSALLKCQWVWSFLGRKLWTALLVADIDIIDSYRCWLPSSVWGWQLYLKPSGQASQLNWWLWIRKCQETQASPGDFAQHFNIPRPGWLKIIDVWRMFLLQSLLCYLKTKFFFVCFFTLCHLTLFHPSWFCFYWICHLKAIDSYMLPD